MSDLPRTSRAPAVVRRVARVEAACAPYDWPWARERREAIDAHWAKRLADQPRLFNGTVLLARDRRFDDDTFRATFFPVDYAAFLMFTELRSPDPDVANAFALGALRTADGAFLLGVMGDHTANAGLAYFPAGTPDPADVTPDGTVDLFGSLVRELREETGLDDDGYLVGDGWTVVDTGTMVALFRPVQLRDDAANAVRKVLAHIEDDPEPELVGVRLVRGGDDLDERTMPAYLLAFLADAFDR